MKLGVALPSMSLNPDFQRLASVVWEAEMLGFDSVWGPDHLLRVVGLILDPLTIFAFVVGLTRRIRLGTNVLMLPYRRLVFLANVTFSLDLLSNGRFVLGIGAEWND